MMRRLSSVSTGTLAALGCFVVLGLLGVYLKFALIGPHWGAIARFLGEAGPEGLTLGHRLGFFVEDIWLNLVAIPLAATLVVAVCARRHRAAAAALISAAASLAYFAELQIQKQVGQYLSRDVVSDLLGWAAASTESTFDYVTPASLLKLALFMSVLAAIVILERLAARAQDSGRLSRADACRRLLWAPVLVMIAGAAATVPAALSGPRPSSPLTRSSLASAAAMLMKTPETAPYAGGVNGTLEAFRQLTSTEPFDAAHAYAGRERQSDAIIFMMETGAAQALDLAAEGRDLPGTGPLFSRSFVASRHYTTHPYSSDALYSVFSGLYPQGRRRVLRHAAAGSIKGLMTNLAADVPVRRVYVPSLYQIELDDEMYEALGADRVYASDENEDDPLREVAERRADEFVAGLERGGSTFDRRARARLRERLRADFQALEKAKADITAAIRAQQRYVVMFFPEIGHGPWVPLRSERTVLERGRTLMLLQDTWLKEILDVVRGFGRLDRTVVAVTGDHGVRTRAEDPALPVGEISEYMFRVPFLVYAPQTLSATVMLDKPTSHIDVAPTLLALLGRSEGLGLMQGVPVWQRSADDRVYLLAFAYGGADGFVENGRYYMRQALSGATFVSSRLLFDDHDQIPASDPAAVYVENGFRRLDALQQALVAQMIERIRNCPTGRCDSARPGPPRDAPQLARAAGEPRPGQVRSVRGREPLRPRPPHPDRPPAARQR